jgi:hypothetical protein
MVNYEKIFDITKRAYDEYTTGEYSTNFAPPKQISLKGIEDNNIYGPDDIGLISDFYKTYWIRVPKCANSNIDRHIRGILQPIHFQKDFDKFARPSEYKGCVVLRDPFQRWISGACTLVKNYIFDEILYEVDELALRALLSSKFLSSAVIEYLFTHLLYDYHGLLQSYYLYPCEMKNLDFFYLNDNTGIHLNEWFKNNGVYNKLGAEKYNDTDKNWIIYKFLHMFFMDNSNEKYKSKIIQSLKLDYDLINSVTFYNKR